MSSFFSHSVRCDNELLFRLVGSNEHEKFLNVGFSFHNFSALQQPSLIRSVVPSMTSFAYAIFIHETKLNLRSYIA